MPLPGTLAAEIAALRTAVRSIDLMNAAYQGRNATASLRNLRTWIKHDEAIEHALAVVQQRCDELEDEINDVGLSGLQGDPEIDRARQTALAAIGELEEQLASARPSQQAVISGIGW
jgi:predicted  nucleic acid-binding Zn-ribbon protein